MWFFSFFSFFTFFSFFPLFFFRSRALLFLSFAMEATAAGRASLEDDASSPLPRFFFVFFAVAAEGMLARPVPPVPAAESAPAAPAVAAPETAAAAAGLCHPSGPKGLEGIEDRDAVHGRARAGGAGRERGACLAAARGASLSLVRPRALEVEAGVEVGAMSRTQKQAILPHAVQLRPPGHASNTLCITDEKRKGAALDI